MFLVLFLYSFGCQAIDEYVEVDLDLNAQHIFQAFLQTLTRKVYYVLLAYQGKTY